MLPETLRLFKENYQNATLSVTEDLADELIEKLTNAEIDVGIMSLPIKPNWFRPSCWTSHQMEKGRGRLYTSSRKGAPSANE